MVPGPQWTWPLAAGRQARAMQIQPSLAQLPPIPGLIPTADTTGAWAEFDTTGLEHLLDPLIRAASGGEG